MKYPLAAIVALLGLLLTGVVVARLASGDRAPATTPADPVDRGSSAGEAAPDDTVTPARPTEDDAFGVALALEGEGLRLFDVETGSARPIPFGTAAAVTYDMLAASRGGEVVEEAHSPECNIDFARLENGLTIWVREEKFVGWTLRDAGGSLTTASGIGIGSSRAAVESVYDARVFESSLGVEFAAGALAGLLESGDPGGKVSNLWAGESCIAR